MAPPPAALLARPMSPQESLLTSSLANERVSKSNGIQIRSLGIMPSDYSTMMHDDFVDDHPEPELLASSVGKEIGGRLIPSSSTISLLSLSDKQQMHGAQASMGQPNPNSGLGPNYTLTSPTMASNVGAKTPTIPIKTGFVVVPPQPQHFNITSGQGMPAPVNTYNRTSSFSHLNQIRMYPYQQRMTSPPPAAINSPGVLAAPTATGPVTSISNSNATSSMVLPNTQLHDSHNVTQTQPISIRSSYQQAVPHLMAYQQQMHGIHAPGKVPDSPNLNPTSLGASPSRFWLSSQTPPQSLTHPSSMMTMTQVHAQNLVQPIAIGSQTRYGGDHLKPSGSPVLNPVQTPKEELPMTPLYLGNMTSADVAGEAQKTEYFNNDFQI